MKAVLTPPSLDQMSARDTSRPAASRAAACRAPTRWAATRPSSSSACASSPTSRCSARSWNLGGSKAKVYFELRDERGALPCSMWRTDFEKLKLDREALADGAPDRGRRRHRLLRGQPHLVPVVHLPGPRPARGRRGRPAGPAGAAAQAAGLRGAVRPPEAAAAAGASAHHRRGHRPDRQGPRRRAGRAGAAGLARPRGVGVRARCRTGAPRRPSRGRSRTWPPPARWTRSWWRAAAARWPTCSPSATRRCAAPWRCCRCR